MSDVELLDVLDDNGKPLGIRKPRTQVHRNGDWHRTVHVWVINPKQEILFQKRALAKESFPGAWDVSAAGHISAGETSMQAAIKELAEEIGICASARELELLHTVVNRSVQHNGEFVDNEFSDVYVAKKDVKIPDLVLQPSEVGEARFISQQELRRIALTHDAAFTPHWQEYSDLIEYLERMPKRLS